MKLRGRSHSARLGSPGRPLHSWTFASLSSHPLYCTADAISALLQSFGVSIETALAALDANSLPAAIQERLNSLILYHVIPSGVLTPAELGAEGEVPTGLEGFTLQFNSEGTVITTPTGTSNVVASGESDGAAYLTIDAALLPAQFADIPQTTTADAQAILASLYQHHASPAAE